jgi:hypothetical protein
MRFYADIKVKMVTRDLATHTLAVCYNLRCDQYSEDYNDYLNWADPKEFTPVTAKRLTQAIEDRQDDDTQYLRYAN